MTDEQLRVRALELACGLPFTQPTKRIVETAEAFMAFLKPARSSGSAVYDPRTCVSTPCKPDRVAQAEWDRAWAEWLSMAGLKEAVAQEQAKFLTHMSALLAKSKSDGEPA